MTSFEIKIFANPTGYDELKLNSKSELFTDELITRRSFDSDGDSFPDGAFSVFYTSEIYIITYHFDVVTEAGFRAPRVHFAVAIRRGFKMENPVDVFNELKIEFNKFAAAQRATGIRGIYTKTTDFGAIIVPHIKRDLDQLCINTEASNDLTRAVVAYKTTEQLECLLEEPMRQNFKFKTGTGILMILEYQAANQVWPKIKDKYSSISLDAAEYKFTCKYELVFPDKHIKIIKSRNEEIDYICEKSFYKPYCFKGNLLEHFTEWKITQSADRTQFIIGLSLEPEVKVWKLQFVNSDDGSMLTKSIPLKTSFGVIEGNSLILKGDEIGNVNDLLLTSLNPQWIVIDRLDFSDRDEEVQVLVKQRMLYNLTQVSLYVKKKYDFSPVFFLYNKDGEEPLAKFDKSNLQQYIDLPYSKAFLQIAESEKYEVYNLFFNSDGSLSPFSLEKKAMFSLNFNIVNEKVKQRMGKGEDLNCRYSVNNKLGEKELTLDDCKISELPEAACVEFRLKFPGYKAYEDKVVISKKLKTVDVYFRPAASAIAWKKFKAVSPYLFMLGLGIYWGLSLSYGELNPNDWGTKKNGIDRLILKNIEDSISSKIHSIYQNEIKNNREEIRMLNLKIDSLELDKAITDKSQKDQNTITDLVRKLKGNEYTLKDINQLNNLGYKVDKELIDNSKKCLILINTRDKTKQKVYIEGEIGKLKYHVEDMKYIIEEQWDAYKTITKRNYETIKEIRDDIKKAVGEPK